MKSTKTKRLLAIILAAFLSLTMLFSATGCSIGGGTGGGTGGGGTQQGGGSGNEGGGNEGGGNEGGGNTGGGVSGEEGEVFGDIDPRGLSAQQYSFANVVGEDEYGRKVTICDPSQPKDKYVGLFYSAWLGEMKSPATPEIYDNTKLIAEGRLSTTPSNTYHFSSEPLYGYYSMHDDWVIRKHLELFIMTGIDYLMFDATNVVTPYAGVFTDVLNILLEYDKQGWDVPKVAFYTNSNSKEYVTWLKTNYYDVDTYKSLWFKMKGDNRPVIVGVSSYNGSWGNGGTDWAFNDTTEIRINSNAQDRALYNYFNFFESSWPNTGRYNENANTRYLPWMSRWNHSPYPTASGNIAASVIQHSSLSVMVSDKHDNASRGFYGWAVEGSEQSRGKNSDWKKGDNLEWQINSARYYLDRNEAKNLLITGWNEWIAIKNPNGGSGNNFCDCYTAEYSRDIEMGKVYGDGFYMQLLRHAREIKYKGNNNIYEMERDMIYDITELGDWEYVFTEYADIKGDAKSRNGENALNVANSYIYDNTNGNDIVKIKISYDSDNLYFYVETAENIKFRDDPYWMNIMISAGTHSKSFMGFDYIINHTRNKTAKTTTVEKCKTNGKYDWQSTGYTAEYYYSGNKIAYQIPLAALGLTEDNVSFSFKVTDNVAVPASRVENKKTITTTDRNPTKLDYYIYGDSAPIGSVGYGYNMISGRQ